MKILIENDETLEYLTTAGDWTKNPQEGRAFPATEAAFQFASREAIRRFTIVFYFPGTNQFVNLDHGRGKGEPLASTN